MSGATSTSPISMRAAANNQKKQRGIFKGWKKNNKAANAEDEPYLQRNNNRVAIDPQQQQSGNNSNWYDDPRQKSPNRRYQTRAAPQFSPSNNHSYHVNGNKQQAHLSRQQINQNYPTNDEYYGYCNDELSRQLHLAAQKDRHSNEERMMAKMKFRKEHCVPYTRNQLAPPSQSQLEQIYQQQQVVKQQIAQQQGGMKIKLPQGQVTGRDLSRPKEDVLTQSTQTTKDTSSVASSLTNTTNGGNVGGQSNGGKVTPVSNALSTAAQVFEQQKSDFTAAGGGGDEDEYVKDWTPMSDSFIQQPVKSGDDFNFKMNTQSRPPQRGNTVGGSSWREAVDPNSGKKYYYNVQTKEVSWTKPDVRRSRTPPPPPPPSNDVTSEKNATHTAKTPHRNNTTGVQRKQQQQQQQERKQQQRSVRSNKSPPRTRASPSLQSIAEDEGNNYDDESDDSSDDDAYGPTSQMQQIEQQQQQMQHPRTRSKSPFRVISSGQSRSPVRHASSSFHADPNRGDDPDGIGSATASSGSSSRRSISPFRVLNKFESAKKKKGKKPVVNRMPSSLRGRGSREAGDGNSLVSHYDDPSIGALSSLDDTTLASRSLSRKSTSVAAASSTEDGGGGSKRRDASETPPRNKKYADPPGESIDEIFQNKVLNRSNGGVQNSPYSRGYHSPHRRERQQQRRLPDPSPMRENQQQHIQHSPYQQHHSPYRGPSPQKQHSHQNRSPYHHNQQQPYLHAEEQQQHRSPQSGQHHVPPQSGENLQHQQYLQQPQIYVDEDGNQWMLTPQEMSTQPSLQPRGQQQPRQIYYDEDGQPYYYEDEEEYVTEQHYQQQIHQQEQVLPPTQLHAPQHGWQWSEEQGPTLQNRHPTQDGHPAEEYFEDGNGNFISFITPDPDDDDNHVLKDFESIGMLTGDEEGLPLDDPNGGADDDTAANTINTVDLVAEVKRVWRHVQRYEQKKSMKADNRIETKESEDEVFVHQFTHAFAQASPARGNNEGNTTKAKKRNMTKAGSADHSTMAASNQDPRKDAVQISQEENEAVSNNRGRSRNEDNRLGQHIRSTSVHSRALSSRGKSPANGSDYAMMSHGDTEMDGAFISEGMDEFFLSPGKPQKSSLKQAKQKEHLLHPSQVAAAQKLMQNKKDAISASAKKSSKVSNSAKHDDLARPYDFDKVKSTGTNYSQKTQTISNTTTSNIATKARERNDLTNRTRTPPRSPAPRNEHVQTQEKGVERNVPMSPGSLYANALKNAKERRSQRERK